MTNSIPSSRLRVLYASHALIWEMDKTENPKTARPAKARLRIDPVKKVRQRRIGRDVLPKRSEFELLFFWHFLGNEIIVPIPILLPQSFPFRAST